VPVDGLRSARPHMNHGCFRGGFLGASSSQLCAAAGPQVLNFSCVRLN
jgi:hypothetical protein